MLKTVIYNMKGDKVNSLSIAKDIYDVKINNNLLHQVITSQLSNKRKNLAHTKTRSEVRGGGTKPWRQKGTGRARAGSSRSPLWRGGGVTFGPRSNKNYHQKINKKMCRSCLMMVLSDKIKNKKIIILDKIIFLHAKTKDAMMFLQNLPIDTGTILIITTKINPYTKLSFQNIPYVKTMLANSLDILDLINHDWLILDKESWQMLEKTYLGKELPKERKLSIKKKPLRQRNKK